MWFEVIKTHKYWTYYYMCVYSSFNFSKRNMLPISSSSIFIKSTISICSVPGVLELRDLSACRAEQKISGRKQAFSQDHQNHGLWSSQFPLQVLLMYNARPTPEVYCYELHQDKARMRQVKRFQIIFQLWSLLRGWKDAFNLTLFLLNQVPHFF